MTTMPDATSYPLFAAHPREPGLVLVANGPGELPSFQAAPGAAVVASGDLAGQRETATLCSHTPAATGVFRVAAYLTILDAGGALQVVVGYTDPAGVARSLAINPATGKGDASAAGAYAFPAVDVRAGGGVPVTVRVTVAGNKPVAYDCGATIQRVR